MNVGPIDLFLDSGKIKSVKETMEVVAAFHELRERRFNSIIESQVALRDMHQRQANEIRQRYFKSCEHYLKELFRTSLAELYQGGNPVGTIHAAHLIWMRHWIDTLKALIDEENAKRSESRGTHNKGPSIHDTSIAAAEFALTPPTASSPETQACIDHFCRSVKGHLGAEALHWITDVMIDTPLKSVVKFEEWLDQPPVELNPLREKCLVLDAKKRERSAAGTRIEFKIYTALNRTTKPLVSHIDRIMDERNFDFQNCMLAKMLSRWRNKFLPQFAIPADTIEHPDYDYFGASLCLQSFFQTEPHHWPTFARGVIELLERPRTFLRWNCGPEHQPIKRQLRAFIEIVAGPIKKPIERNDLLARLKAPDVSREEILTLTSEYLAILCDPKNPPPQFRRELDPLVFGWIDNLPRWLSRLRIAERKFFLRRADDVEFEKLLAEETAAEAEAAELRATWSHFHMEKAEGVETSFLDETETIAIAYLENLGAESWRTHTIECPRHDFAITLDFHLFDRGVETVVPVSSICRAIEHYLFEMTPDQRSLVPMERIAGEPWRKLKRGGQRIYILEKDGEVFLHLMKRKDWVVASEQEARF